jgi:hypothetical protein
MQAFDISLCFRRTLGVLAFIVCAFPSNLRAGELGVRGGVSPIESKGRFAAAVENDLFSFGVGPGTDRFYTNGIYLHSEWSSPLLDDRTAWLGLAGFVPAQDRAYLGFGLAHELHTPQTLNPCGAVVDDPEVTSYSLNGADPQICLDAERDWGENYRSRDVRFTAVWALFLSIQRYFHNQHTQGALSQYRVWSRFDLGTHGRGAAHGFEVQKHWHGFFNEALEKEGEDLSVAPAGWRIPDEGKVFLLTQLSAGTDLSLYRSTRPSYVGPLGYEVFGLGHFRLGLPRNQAGVGLRLLAGILPEHASMPLSLPGQYQRSSLVVQASARATGVASDPTHGAKDQRAYFTDDYSLGLRGKLVGVAVSATLNWQRNLFLRPLALYPSNDTIDTRYHRYGRVSLELSY